MKTLTLITLLGSFFIYAATSDPFYCDETDGTCSFTEVGLGSSTFKYLWATPIHLFDISTSKGSIFGGASESTDFHTTLAEQAIDSFYKFCGSAERERMMSKYGSDATCNDAYFIYQQGLFVKLWDSFIDIMFFGTAKFSSLSLRRFFLRSLQQLLYRS